jgi:hypothetical protein
MLVNVPILMLLYTEHFYYNVHCSCTGPKLRLIVISSYYNTRGTRGVILVTFFIKTKTSQRTTGFGSYYFRLPESAHHAERRVDPDDLAKKIRN